MNKGTMRNVLVWIALAVILAGISGFFLYSRLSQKSESPGFNKPTDSNSAPSLSPNPTLPIPQGVKANKLGISEGTQGQFGDLRIGLGYTRVADYVDDKGIKQRGNVAGLWIYVRDNSAQNRTLDVYAGQSFMINKYRIFVDQITVSRKILPPGQIGGQGGSVSLFIWEPTTK